MRIISGTFRGKKFFPPSDISARPTTDIAKEALFNILQNLVDFEEVRFLDLFAGTGSLDYELFSRGCRHMVLVDLSPISIRFIQKMTAELGMSNHCRIIKSDVLHYIETENNSYNLVFAGPPYALESIATLPDRILSRGILEKGGILIVETSQYQDFSKHANFTDVRRYGQTHFWFFEHTTTTTDE